MAGKMEFLMNDEGCPLWVAITLPVVVFGLMASMIPFLQLIGALALAFGCGCILSIETIYRNQTGEHLPDSGVADATWYVFVIAKRQRSDQQR